MEEMIRSAPSVRTLIPKRPIERLTNQFDRFFHIEAAGGLILLGCAIIALLLANSPYAPAYQAFWQQSVRISIGSFALDYPLWYWINDGLMTIFFFVIGLEIKREVVHGELSDPAKIVMPIVCAIGGAVAPVLIFLSLQFGHSGQAGWAVPMATDIAFLVGCLALYGNRVPRGLRIFLLTLAIVDDILAVIVIAMFYAGKISVVPLACSVAGFGIIVLLNRVGVRTVTAYTLVGVAIWLCTLKSGIHPTVAGVALGLLTPAGAWLGDRSLVEVISRAAISIQELPGNGSHHSESRSTTLSTMQFAARESMSPLERLERSLHPWVAFGIMPVFALANAGVAVDANTLGSSLAAAVVAGLVLGKPAGILLAAAIAVYSGYGRLPNGTSWRVMLGSGCLAGIGFTMSLFVASLGLAGQQLLEVKGGVLIGSGASLVIGMGLLYFMLPRGDTPADEKGAGR